MYRDLGLRSEVIADAILALKPRTDRQKFLQSQAESLAESVLQGRWQIFIGIESSVPGEFLGILGYWLAVTFWSFGLFPPPQPYGNHRSVCLLPLGWRGPIYCA